MCELALNETVPYRKRKTKQGRVMLPHGFRDQPWTLDCTTQGLAVGQNMVGDGKCRREISHFLQCALRTHSLQLDCRKNAHELCAPQP